MKPKMFFTVFTFINRNRMFSSKWWQTEGKCTGYWTAHFKLKKDKKGIVFKCFTSVPPVLRDSDFYHIFLLQTICYIFLDMRFPTEINCGFTIFAEFQQQKKPPFEETFQVVFVGDCCHHSGQTNLKPYGKPTARNFTVQSSSMVVKPDTVLSSPVLLLDPSRHNGLGVLKKTLTFLSVSGLLLLSLWQMGNQQRS